MAYSSYDERYEKNIAKKKKVVNELLALRRMKYNQKLKEQRKRDLNLQGDFVFEANEFKSSEGKSEHAAKLLSGSLLESEALKLKGETAKEDLIGHYVTNKFAKKDVLTELFQSRKDALQEKQVGFYDKEVELIKTKVKIGEEYQRLKDDAKKVDIDIPDPLPDYGNKKELSTLVKTVKSSIYPQEQNLRRLKLNYQKYGSSEKQIPPAINYSFQPWQEEQVNICKEIMNEIVDNVLLLCFGPIATADASMIEALLQSDHAQWEKMIAKGLKQDAIFFIIQELVVEVSDEMILEIAEIHCHLKQMSKVLAADLVIKSSELVGGNAPRKVKDQKGKIIDQIWSEITTRRLKSKMDIWSHSQATVSSVPKVENKVVPTKSKAKVPQPPIPEVIQNEGDIELITYEYVPVKTTTAELAESTLKPFVKSEFQYWEEMSQTVLSNPINMSANKVLGISCISPSFNHDYIAVGTFRGDILIYNVNWVPFRPIRCVALSKPPHSSIVSIVWTFDGSRIVSLNKSGIVIVWSVIFSSSTTLIDGNLIGLPDDKHMKYKCQQLTALVALTHKNKEFTFISGPLAASVKDDSIPNVVKFNSNLSSTCSQDYLVIGFESGNILNCDLTHVIRSRFEELLHIAASESGKGIIINGTEPLVAGNKIAQEIDCELYRGHRAQILAIFFLNNSGNMISMDSNLIICVWEDSKDYLSGFNWFTPVKKIKLKDTEEILAMKGTENVIFEDIFSLKTAKGKKTKGKAVIEQERREVVAELKALRINERSIWERDDIEDGDDNEKSKNKKSKFITKTYASLPEEIVDNVSDQLFHIVTKHKDKNLVVKYSTQEYASGSHKATSLLDYKPSFDGNKLYFMFMYDKFSPNIKRHITFVDLNLELMDMAQSSVLKYNISQEQFDDISKNPNHACFSISKVFRASGSEYMFCNIAGTMQVFSCVSGGHVVETAELKQFKHTDGLKMPKKSGKFIDGNVSLFTLNPTGLDFYVIVSPIVTDSKTYLENAAIKFTDNSVDVRRKELLNSYDELLSLVPSDKSVNFNVEQAFLREKYTVRDLPVSIYAQMMIYAIIDNAVAVAGGVRMGKDQRTKVWKQDWKRMEENWVNENIDYAT